jgi:AAA domain, putative AbiEii toxin, Type IV TA system/AAA ATPase domain
MWKDVRIGSDVKGDSQFGCRFPGIAGGVLPLRGEATPLALNMKTKNRLQSIRLQKFKRINDAAMDLKGVNVLVGGNNSGKSSIIQGLHFGVGLLQTIALADKWVKSGSTSLNPNQLIYSPSEDVYALGPGGKLFESEDQAIRLDLNMESGEACSVEVRKGRNRNILVGVANPTLAQQLSSLENPFSIFSPGLAGISKRETYVSDGVLFRTLARGDANLVLRNILLRLSETDAWSPFLSDLRDVFPELDIEVAFKKETDELIDVKIRTIKDWVPLEIAGTGVLQATQILSYIHRFEPAIVVLDEPDSHLHPNNQRLLCALLRRVSEDRGTQVLLTTHSRHVVDAVGTSSGFFWVRNGSVDIAEADDEVGILLDIGALDVKERAGQPDTRAVVLTEDEITRPLEAVLQSSGFDLNKTAILPYYGVTGIKQLQPLVKVIRGTNPKAKVIIHRDRDFLTDEEIEKWKTDVRALSVEPFATKGRDVESYFINSEVLAELNPGSTRAGLDLLIREVAEELKTELVADYVNGRIDVARKFGKSSSLNHGALAVEANKSVSSDSLRFCGKAALRAIRAKFQAAEGKDLSVFRESKKLYDDSLGAVAKKVFKKL